MARNAAWMASQLEKAGPWKPGAGDGNPTASSLDSFYNNKTPSPLFDFEMGVTWKREDWEGWVGDMGGERMEVLVTCQPTKDPPSSLIPPGLTGGGGRAAAHSAEEVASMLYLTNTSSIRITCPDKTWKRHSLRK
jgi:hypothetical protein